MVNLEIKILIIYIVQIALQIFCNTNPSTSLYLRKDDFETMNLLYKIFKDFAYVP
jgi:hypothetical protein